MYAGWGVGDHSGVGMFYSVGSYELREEKKVVKVEGEGDISF